MHRQFFCMLQPSLLQWCEPSRGSLRDSCSMLMNAAVTSTGC